MVWRNSICSVHICGWWHQKKSVPRQRLKKKRGQQHAGASPASGECASKRSRERGCARVLLISDTCPASGRVCEQEITRARVCACAAHFRYLPAYSMHVIPNDHTSHFRVYTFLGSVSHLMTSGAIHIGLPINVFCLFFLLSADTPKSASLRMPSSPSNVLAAFISL